MAVKKIYAGDHEQDTLVCEQCGKTKVINIADVKNSAGLLEINCDCGHIFSISIETRKFDRKNVNLPGAYVKMSDDMSKVLEEGSMIVEDISRGGIGFRTKIKHNIRVQDVIQVRYRLDNDKRSEVSITVVVKRVDEYFVGTAFPDFSVW